MVKTPKTLMKASVKASNQAPAKLEKLSTKGGTSIKGHTREKPKAAKSPAPSAPSPIQRESGRGAGAKKSMTVFYSWQSDLPGPRWR
ncbi:MAG: hypothetical protein ACYDD1_00865 [Caulobacteraceae bacterium]